MSMPDIPIENKAYCIVGGTIALGTVAGVLRRVCWCELRSRIWSALQVAREALRWAREPDDSEVGAIVKEKMQKLKLDNFRVTFHVFCMLAWAMVVAMIAAILRGLIDAGSWWRLGVQMTTFASLALVTVFPSTLSHRTIDWFYSVIILCASVYVAPWVCAPDEGLFYVLCVDLAVLFLNVVRGRAVVILPLNLPYVLSSSATVILMPRELLPMRVEFLVLVQLLFLTGIPLCVRWLEVSVSSAIRHSVEAQATKELLAAASALLRSCCDVVVELDADGVIVCPALDLGSFLLRGTSCNLLNSRLSDLLSTEEDQVLLQKKLSAPRPSGLSVAEAIHVHMRDSDSNLLKVEVLSFEFRHLDGRPRHMTGLREFTDAQAAGGRRLQAQREAAAAARGSSPTPTDPLTLSSDEDEGSEPSMLSSAASSTNPFDVEQAVAIVDTTSERWLINGFSSGFHMRVGRLAPGTCLRDILAPDCGDKFAAWLKMACRYGALWPKIRVVLVLRHGKYKGYCSVAQESEGEAVDPERVHLHFQDVKRTGSHSDGCGASKPHTNFKGTPVLHLAL